jgi:hypothetical protein
MDAVESYHGEPSSGQKGVLVGMADKKSILDGETAIKGSRRHHEKRLTKENIHDMVAAG